MEIYGLDSSFNRIDKIPYLNLQWNRKYYEPGDFSVQILASEYDPNVKYIYAEGRDNIGIVQKRELTQKLKGSFIQLEGMFLEALLNEKAVYPTYYGSGTPEAMVREMFTTYKGDLPHVALGDESGITQESVVMQETGAWLGDKVYELLKPIQLAPRLRWEYTDDTAYFEVWQGVDRTQSQNVNPFVIFADTWENITNVKATTDDSKYCNYAIVAGEGEADERIYVTVDIRPAGSTDYARQVFIDARDLRYDSAEQTLAEYQASLVQRGHEKLTEYVTVKALDFDAVQGAFNYLTDYDLGDKVDVVISSLQESFQERILEVHEVFKAGQHKISLDLGDRVSTKYNTVSRL